MLEDHAAFESIGEFVALMGVHAMFPDPLPVTIPANWSKTDRTAKLIRDSFAKIEPSAGELTQFFYGVLFTVSPAARALFPANMNTQRDRLLRALVHVVGLVDQPDQLVPFLHQLGRDHRKFDVVAQHYDAVGVALLAALKRYLKDDWTADVERAWTDAYGIIAKSMREAAETEKGPAWWPARVIEHRRPNSSVAVIRALPRHPVPFRAGQYLSVQVPQRPRMWRYFSPATAPRTDGVLEFHVRAVDGGWVSRSMVNHTKIGDEWRIGPALGTLAVRQADKRKLLLIAGGTGLAPLRAIADDLARWKQNPAVHLFFGGRTAEDLYDLPTLKMLAATNPWLTVAPVVEEGEVKGGEQGTLVDAVLKRGTWPKTDVLISGSPTMIRATMMRLMEEGIPADRIKYDQFTID
ncbi:Ferredoxin--NAD(P)(+) reductase (naphthalene dioxygenase ferredoxin-specific) [Amycolatopsis sp. YIM 10]|nr:Ferredoxin--NAD(P)(+) reductase (naphthalene dioxygenase ferredoxin-specific) [Amycolatopsis sp. YIM 10]